MTENKDLEKRLAKNCEESIGEAIDSLWASNGKFVWISQKQIFCQHFISQSDLEEIKNVSMKLSSKYETLEECKNDIQKYNNSIKQNKFESALKRAENVLQSIKTLIQYLDKLVNEMQTTIDKRRSEDKSQNVQPQQQHS